MRQRIEEALVQSAQVDAVLFDPTALAGRHRMSVVSRRRCAPEIDFRSALSRNRGE